MLSPIRRSPSWPCTPATRSGPRLFGEKALAMAGEGPSQARAQALNNMGTVRMIARYPEGLEDVEESFAMSADLRFTHDQVRAAANIGWCAIYYRDLPTAELWTSRAHELAMEREMVWVDSFTLGELALIDEMRGQWAEAESKARDVLQNLGGYDTTNSSQARCWAGSRRVVGSPTPEIGCWTAGNGRCRPTRSSAPPPASIALAEYVWIGGKLDQTVLPGLHDVLADCFERDSPWMAGELAYWLYLIGEIDQIPDVAPEPYQLSGAGDWEGAAAFWEERGIPYDRAVALSTGSTEARLASLTIFDDLGAIPVAARLRSELARAVALCREDRSRRPGRTRSV